MLIDHTAADRAISPVTNYLGLLFILNKNNLEERATSFRSTADVSTNNKFDTTITLKTNMTFKRSTNILSELNLSINLPIFEL